ncbi:MAG: hypothetical protein ACOX4O_08720 [Eubacteriales bacterium]|jgi:hypothetical protein
MPGMQKSMYSLMLSDGVVAEIDRIASQNGMSRSALVDGILADYASLMTPEKRIAKIFEQLEAFINGDTSALLGDRRSEFGEMPDITPYFVPNQLTMSLKSSLEYKYRPTIRYEVQMYRSPVKNEVGELSVIYRTQSSELLSAVTGFFRLWQRLESAYITPGEGYEISWSASGGKFSRGLYLRRGYDYTNEQIGTEIGEYIRMLDTIMKKYLSQGYETARELENDYVYCLERGIGRI